jgi:hypothetical protein
MDDTAVFATSRQKLVQKLTKLKEITDQIGMIIHPTKSKYINVNTNERDDLEIDGVNITYTNEYVYLGTPISNKTIAKQVKAHLHMKSPHALKFSSFLSKNSDSPFCIKETVWKSVVLSAFLYSSETWLTKDLRSAEGLYMKTLKEMLGVRHTTSNNLVLIETGSDDAKTTIRIKQVNYYKKLLNRTDYNISYLHQVITMAINVKAPMGKSLDDIINTALVECNLERIKNETRKSERTRCKTYCEMNTDLSKCVIYSKMCTIPEHLRIPVTRLRLSSHRLRIETGRWARIPREDRLCPCGDLQTEEHVLLHCRLTENLRENYPIVKSFENIGELLSFKNLDTANHVCIYCYKVLNVFT